MTLPFAIIAIVTIAAAVAAMSLRNLVHCALALTVAFAGLAAAYLQLDAQFVGFTQILVYVGAVAILVVFAILLTRGGETSPASGLSPSWLSGVAVSVSVVAVLVWAINRSAILVLIGIELMLNAANLNFIAFWRFSEHPENLTGILFVIFSIGVAAAEAAVGLALIIAIYRHYRTTNVDEVNSLKG